MKTNPTNNLSTLISTFATIQAAYPKAAIHLNFTLNADDEQTHLWDAPDGKLYLWAIYESTLNNQSGNITSLITLYPTDNEEIEDAGLCTKELTTPEGLTIILAEDF